MAALGPVGERQRLRGRLPKPTSLAVLRADLTDLHPSTHSKAATALEECRVKAATVDGSRYLLQEEDVLLQNRNHSSYRAVLALLSSVRAFISETLLMLC